MSASPPLPHPLRPRRSDRRARAREPRAAGARLRESARRISSSRAGSRRARGGSTATRSTRSGESSSRSRPGTSTSSGTTSLGLECFPSTGHASHHVSMLHDDGTLYAGDSMGVRIAPGALRPRPDPAARHRPRGLGGDDRRRPSAASRPPRADPLRRLRGRSRPPRAAPRHAAALGRPRRPRDGRGDVRRGRPGGLPCLRPRRGRGLRPGCPYSQCYLGLERYWRKRGESAA